MLNLILFLLSLSQRYIFKNIFVRINNSDEFFMNSSSARETGKKYINYQDKKYRVLSGMLFK